MNANIKDMEELLADSPKIYLPRPGSIIDGHVVDLGKNYVLVDLNGVATGIIRGREAKDSHNTMADIKVGDPITAFVVDDEDPEGLVVLSFRKASQEKTWSKFVSAYENNEPITVTSSEANKGGLLLNIDGIKGFLPVSQLAPMNYPRVNGADASQILTRLKALVGKSFTVKIINLDRENGKLILSEKAAMHEQREAAMSGLKAGDKLKGKISGIVKFGIFVAFSGLEGLVHISEIAWGHVSNPNDFGKIGDDVDVEIIGIENNKISLSMKRLSDDPWLKASKKYKLGGIIKGDINRITPFGIFIKLDADINGLIHVTEFGDDPTEIEKYKIGDNVDAKIIAIEANEHRIGLSLDLDAKIVEKKEEEEEETE